MASNGPKKLSDEEAAVYDRQLRVWGAEVQTRLSSSRVLILGGSGLAAEVSKNIVLAGVGHVALADDTPCSHAPFGNFLVPADASTQCTVAEACARTLQAMNPFIEVYAVRAASGSSLLAMVPQYDVVLSAVHGITSQGAAELEEACCAAGKQVFLAQTLGACTCTYINLGGSHTYAEKGQQQVQQQGSEGQGQAGEAAGGEGGSPAGLKVMAFPRLAAALSKPVGECLGRRPIHPMYQVLRVLQAHERSPGGQQQGTEGTLARLEGIAADLEARERAPPGSISRAHLRDCAASLAAPPAPSSTAAADGGSSSAAGGAAAGVGGGGGQGGEGGNAGQGQGGPGGGAGVGRRASPRDLLLAPAAAVVGGVVANAMVRAISRVGAPLRNFFFYSPGEGQGMVEDIGGPSAAAK